MILPTSKTRADYSSCAASSKVAAQTLPTAYALANNHPNPFNPATTISYALPQAADVALTVFNIADQAVRTLVAEHQRAGYYVVAWDATEPVLGRQQTPQQKLVF